MKSDSLSFIPNESGIPNQDQTASKIEQDLSKWKMEREKRSCQKFAKMPYWKKVSTCVAL